MKKSNSPAVNMTAEEIASKIIATERYDTSETPFKEGAKLIIAFAESLAKERAVEFAEYIDQKYQLMIDGTIEENFDTFLAEKRKEGTE